LRILSIIQLINIIGKEASNSYSNCARIVTRRVASGSSSHQKIRQRLYAKATSRFLLIDFLHLKLGEWRRREKWQESRRRRFGFAIAHKHTRKSLLNDDNHSQLYVHLSHFHSTLLYLKVKTVRRLVHRGHLNGFIAHWLIKTIAGRRRSSECEM
jgi:hypothetical protein